MELVDQNLRAGGHMEGVVTEPRPVGKRCGNDREIPKATPINEEGDVRLQPSPQIYTEMAVGVVSIGVASCWHATA
jgi:hypothetical protein